MQDVERSCNTKTALLPQAKRFFIFIGTNLYVWASIPVDNRPTYDDAPDAVVCSELGLQFGVLVPA
jgi:hypothetical protein